MRAACHCPALLVLLFALPLAATAQPAMPGRVVDDRSGAGIPARVEIIDTKTALAADADGRFVVDTAGAERLTLAVSHPGYYVHRVTVDVPTVASLEIRLVPIVTVADRIEVTASRAREGVDAASFTNVPQEKVADAHWGQDPAILLAQIVPGVYATNDSGHGIGYSYFSIRGFGQARTRVMLNAAPLNDAESGELFFIDLADFMSTAGDVQVQRGVSGLSGLGGALDITTALPPVTRSFTVHAGAGAYGTRRLNVRWDSGLVEGSWAFSARYSRITTDGYRDQSWVDMWNYYFAAARFGERSRVRVVLFGGPEQTHLAYLGVGQAALDGQVTGDVERDRRANPLTYPGEIDNFFQPHYQVIHDLTFSPRARFSQTIYGFLGKGYYDQYRARRWLFEYNLPDVVLPGGVVVRRSDLVRRRSVDEWDAGWVPAFSFATDRYDLEVTGEVRIHRAHHAGEVKWAQFYPAGVPPDRRYYDYRVAKNTAAGAVSGRYRLAPRLALTGGLQVTHHEYALDRDLLRQVTFTAPYTFVLPRAGAVVSLGPSADAYVSVTRGQREPFFRNLYDPQDYYSTRAELAPEEVWNVEVGTSVRRDRWRLRGNAYWMNFLNEIVYAGALDDNGVPIYGNGATSRRLGVEVDGSAALTRHLAIDGMLSLARNRITRYREYDFDGSAVVYDGNPVAGFPGVMASLALRAQFGAGRATLAVRHAGRFFLDNTGDEARVNPAHTVADVAFTIALPERLWRATALARAAELDLRLNNVFDARYTSFGYVDGGTPLYIPAAGRHFYMGLTLGF